MEVVVVVGVVVVVVMDAPSEPVDFDAEVALLCVLGDETETVAEEEEASGPVLIRGEIDSEESSGPLLLLLLFEEESPVDGAAFPEEETDATEEEEEEEEIAVGFEADDAELELELLGTELVGEVVFVEAVVGLFPLLGN